MRKTDLMKSTIGIVVIIVMAIVLLGLFRVRLTHTSKIRNGAVLFNEKTALIVPIQTVK